MRYSLLMLLAGTSAQAATLSVVISNFQNEIGSVNVAVYSDKETWLKSGRAMSRQSANVSEAIREGTVSFEFELEPGEYAVVAHHDDNGNGKLDTSFVGIPKEPTGASNGEVSRFGPPRYKNAVFQIGKDGVTMPIRLSD